MSDEPLTPERAARECAEKHVRVEHHDREPGFNEFIVFAFGRQISAYAPLDLAEGICREYRDLLAAAILAAIERYARSLGGLPSPLSDERLEEIEAGCKDWREAGSPDAVADDLLAEVLHLRASLREIVRSGCEPEAYALGMARGEALGAAKQREADVAAARGKSAEYRTARTTFSGTEAVADAVASVPLVTDSEDAQ